jgi:hypothetical protein
MLFQLSQKLEVQEVKGWPPQYQADDIPRGGQGGQFRGFHVSSPGTISEI